MLSRVEKFEAALAQTECDAVLVTNLKNIYYLTGFSGTASDHFIGWWSPVDEAGSWAPQEIDRKSLYILDEPTTDLHTEDISRLLKVLDRFVDDGNSVLVIEHNIDVIKTVDHIIDLGPKGGVGGGTIIATGTPEKVAANPASYTAQYLKGKLN